MKDVMNLAQLASYLQMSQASVYHLVADGKIPGIKVGKQWRFSKALIDKWLENSGKSSADVLVVDDDPLVRNIITEAMREAGHMPTNAESVSQALTLLREFEFDIVFLDLLLPDGTGFDLIKGTAQMPSPPKIIVVTGHPEHELVDKIRVQFPHITILGKPARLKTLLEMSTNAIAGKLRMEVDE